ncbi:uncharacterized protein LOC131167269 [Malania oleifera]|uniref:uncharacterized protein LOC131167269 n=1 Tax=Malania oleifera TaxID=397392 RepID=UPI0025ADC886|nr:uncharacterized protein LOC131167269 [Malania oleifera]
MKNQILQRCGNVEEADKLLKSWGQNPKLCYDFWRDNEAKVPWFKEVWKCGCTPKYAFTLWLGIKGKLLTSDKVYGDDVDRSCVLCGKECETMDHIFFKCDFTSYVWNNLRRWMGIRRDMSTLKAALKWLHKEAKGNGMHSVGKKICLATTVYFIWHFRNKRRFDGMSISANDMIQVIQRHTYRTVFDRYGLHAIK